MGSTSSNLLPPLSDMKTIIVSFLDSWKTFPGNEKTTFVPYGQKKHMIKRQYVNEKTVFSKIKNLIHIKTILVHMCHQETHDEKATLVTALFC